MAYKYVYNNKTLNLGDIINISLFNSITKTQYNIPVVIQNEQVIIYLIDSGIQIQKIYLKEKIINKDIYLNKDETSHSCNCNSYISKRSTKLGHDIESRMKHIKPDGLWINISEETEYYLFKISPAVVYNLYSKQIAKELDKSYNNHISECEILWTIDDCTGKPWKFEKDKVSEEWWNNMINNYGCFRNEVDLIVSQKLLKDLKKYVWTGKSRRNK